MAIELKVRVWIHNTCADFPCLLCGASHEQDHVAASLVEYEDGQAEVLGDVCPACLAAGPSGAADGVRSHATRLRARADWLEELADAVAGMGTDVWATPDELHEAECDADRVYLAEDRADAKRILARWPNPTKFNIQG